MGHEKTMSALLPALAGANLIYGPGMLDMGMTFSFAQLVIDDEIAAMVKRILRGASCDDDLMGVDLIKQVGIGGHFLDQMHSMKYLKTEQVQQTILERRNREIWEKKGAKELKTSAHEKASGLLKERRPLVLPPDVLYELDRIIRVVEEKGEK